eukprot:gene13333-4181_t
MAGGIDMRMHKPHHQWLERVERKVFNVFESLRAVYLDILEGSSLISNLEEPNYCQNCKRENKEEIAKSSCLDDDFQERCLAKYNSELEFWKKRLLKRKDEYKLPESATNHRKENSSKEAHIDLDQNERIGKADCTNPGPVIHGDKNAIESIKIYDNEVYPKKDSNTMGLRTEKEIKASDKYDASNELQIGNDETASIDEKIIDITKNEDSERFCLDDGVPNKKEEDPSWKRAFRNLKSKQSSKVKYQECSKNHANTSINDFFKPKQIAPIRNIHSRRSKRQVSEDSSLKLPDKKRTKETEKGTHSSLLEEKRIDMQDKDIDKTDSLKKTKPVYHRDISSETDEAGGLGLAKTKVCSTNDHCGSLKRDPCKSLRIAFDTGDIDTSLDDTHFLPTQAKSLEQKHRNIGKETGSVVSDTDVTRWGVQENLGLPSFASTPMLQDRHFQRAYQNGNDFDETMWSAPQSPSVVPPVFSTPEKPIGNGIPSSDVKESKPKETKGDVNAGKTPLPIDTFQSHGHGTEVSYDSHHRSKRYDLTCKTSDADLSCDMFHGSTLDSESNPKDDESKEELLTKNEDFVEKKMTKKQSLRKDVENEDYFNRFKKMANPDIDYKYNVVVRKREERDKLDGFECRECAAWYKDELDNEEKRKHLKLVCRHKAVSAPPPSTPDGFWSLDIPATQEYIEKGHMYDENDPLPVHAMPKERRNMLQGKKKLAKRSIAEK